MTSKKFPGLEIAPERRWSEPAAARSKTGRVAVTIAIFMLVVGGIAWVVQFLPSDKRLPAPVPDTDNADRPAQLLRFADAGDEQAGRDFDAVIKAVWDPKDNTYAFEVERDRYGSYDFYFENPYAGAVQLGLESTSCDCSTVKVALLTYASLKSRWDKLEARRRQGDREAHFSESDLPWTPLDQVRGFTVPKDGKGLIRVDWHARKPEGTRLRLSVKIWANPDGVPAQRVWSNLETSTIVIPKLLFDVGKVSLGTLAGGTTSGAAIAFSATRKQLDLQVANDNPLFSWQITPLEKKSLPALEKRLRKAGLNTRIRAAAAIRLTVAEEKNGKIVDQGPFQRQPVLTMDGESLSDGLPVFHGRVRGNVKISGLDETGKIPLRSFLARDGVRHRIFLFADRQVTLRVHRRIPAFVEAKLTESLKEATATERKWVLEISVPRGSPPGPFAEDSAILLRTDAAPPRRIRIPLQGVAVPG